MKRKIIKVPREQCYVGRHVSKFGKEVLAKFDIPVMEEKTCFEILMSVDPLEPLLSYESLEEWLFNYCENNNREGRWRFSEKKIKELDEKEYNWLMEKVLSFKINNLHYHLESAFLQETLTAFENGTSSMFHLFNGELTEEEYSELRDDSELE